MNPNAFVLFPGARHHALARAVLALGLAAQLQYAMAQTVRFDVPAQPLAPALAALAAQAGLQLAFAPELAEGRRAPAVQGTRDVADALRELLAGSGLQGRVQGRTLVVERVAHDSRTLGEVTVTAVAVRDSSTEGTGSYTAAGPTTASTGLPLTLRETPQSVTVMTRQRMDDFKLETLADVIEQTPGVTVHRQGNAIDFQSRGSSVNLLTDGVRQFADGWYFFSSTLYSLDDMADIDRIEVLKGASGLLNGYGAQGGSINMIRKRPTREFQASASASLGSWGNRRAEVDLAGPLNAAGSLRGRLVASAAEGASFRDHEKKSSQMLFGAVEADLTPDTLLSAGFTYRHRTVDGMGSTQPILAYTRTGQFVGWQPRSFNTGASWTGYGQDSLGLFARLEQRLSGDWKAKLQVGHQNVSMDEMRLGHLYDESTAFLNHWKDSRNRNWTVNLDLQGSVDWWGRTHELVAGLGTSHYRGDMLLGDSRNVPLADLGVVYGQGGGALRQPDFADWTYGDNRFTRKQTYVYGAGRFHLAEPLRLIVGGRATDYDRKDTTPFWWNYDMKERGVFTPFAGLVLDVGRDVSLYGSATSIFEPQSGQTEQGRTLEPEKGVTYEVGAKGEFFDKRLNASISHFWMHTDNTAEETGGTTPSGDTAYRAVKGARRHGFELEMSGQLASGWQAQGSYVMNSSSLTSASAYPRHQFKLGTTYRFTEGALRGLMVGAATRWQSAISVSSGSATLGQSAYWLLDLTARYQIDQHWSLGLNLLNVTDKAYFSGVTNFGALHYTWGAPRSVNVSMRYDF